MTHHLDTLFQTLQDYGYANIPFIACTHSTQCIQPYFMYFPPQGLFVKHQTCAVGESYTQVWNCQWRQKGAQ